MEAISVRNLSNVDYRRADNLILSDFALRSWHVLHQYDKAASGKDPADTYEVTLNLCVLQALLTNCWELKKYLSRSRGRALIGALESLVGDILDSDASEIETNPPGRALDVIGLIEHVRNALSHPRMRETVPPTTGYATVADDFGAISAVRFTDSPDVNSRGTLRAWPETISATGGDIAKARFVTVGLSIASLRVLTESLALVLAQPALGNWDRAELVQP